MVWTVSIRNLFVDKKVFRSLRSITGLRSPVFMGTRKILLKKPGTFLIFPLLDWLGFGKKREILECSCLILVVHIFGLCDKVWSHRLFEGFYLCPWPCKRTSGFLGLKFCLCSWPRANERISALSSWAVFGGWSSFRFIVFLDTDLVDELMQFMESWMRRGSFPGTDLSLGPS